MNKGLTHFLTRGVPMTAWVVVLYAVLVYADQLIAGGMFIERTLF